MSYQLEAQWHKKIKNSLLPDGNIMYLSPTPPHPTRGNVHGFL
jgi:hypothetical protein